MPNNSAVPLTVPTNPAERELHGVTVVDEYAWMRTEPGTAFGEYLHAERAYYDRTTAHLEDLREALFDEVERRLLPTDESVSWKHGDLFYYMRSVTGSEYGQFMSTRDPAEPGAVCLDEATLASESGGFAAIGVRLPSPDNRLLAYSVDTNGDEVYTLRFRSISTNEDLPDTVPRSYEGGAWSCKKPHNDYAASTRTRAWRSAASRATSTPCSTRRPTGNETRYAPTAALSTVYGFDHRLRRYRRRPGRGAQVQRRDGVRPTR